MSVPLPFGSPCFQTVARGLVALHRLIRTGRDESPEADAVRDSLDAPLAALSKAEKERAQWLSEDLYSVGEPTDLATREITPQVQRRLDEANDVRRSREWDRALALLRQLGGEISPALLSHMRGAIWQEAGVPDAAAEFLRHAAECDPVDALR